MRRVRHKLLVPIVLALAAGCTSDPPERGDAAAGRLPSLLLVTLDTTRADAVEPESEVARTPNLADLAAAGVRFTQAYTTAPETLPAHASMLTGLYPAGHGVHENARRLAESHYPVTLRLRELGYATAAFVSAYPLARRFGLARGFEVYDDDFAGGAAERPAGETTERALAYLGSAPDGPLFLWVHYFDPHHPYEPPEPFATEYADTPYHGEVAYMDQELGRLLAGFRGRVGEASHRILVVGDHGEGLGDHGEAFHGYLLYQGVMRVPLVIAGNGIGPGKREDPVSVRRVHDTLLHWAGATSARGLLDAEGGPVLAEAMKPYLQFGWQPQVMGVFGRHKAIRSGGTEIYDVVADPAESRDLQGEARLDPALAQALRDYPVPDPQAAPADDLSEEERRQLAGLGYVGWEGGTPAREDAPSAREMTHLFADLDLASGLFVRERYAEAIEVFDRLLEQDPDSYMIALRKAVAHSGLGQEREALAAFHRAAALAPDLLDVQHYMGLHYLRAGDWDQAASLLETVLAATPDRLPAVEGLARARERQGRLDEARRHQLRAVELGGDSPAGLRRLGELSMAVGDTPAAIEAFERLERRDREAFDHHLELGVLYLAAGRAAEARDALDRVPAAHPGYPMALFKRAQVSVVLGEPDSQARIQAARDHADATTAPLIEAERLFR